MLFGPLVGYGDAQKGRRLAAVALVVALDLKAVIGDGWRDQGCGSKHDTWDGESNRYLPHGVLPCVLGRECMSLSGTCAQASARKDGECHMARLLDHTSGDAPQPRLS